MMPKVICVVDNTVMKDTDLQSEHGLVFWIETEHGNVLFDAGQTVDVLFHNLDELISFPPGC